MLDVNVPVWCLLSVPFTSRPLGLLQPQACIPHPKVLTQSPWCHPDSEPKPDTPSGGRADGESVRRQMRSERAALCVPQAPVCAVGIMIHLQIPGCSEGLLGPGGQRRGLPTLRWEELPVPVGEPGSCGQAMGAQAGRTQAGLAQDGFLEEAGFKLGQQAESSSEVARTHVEFLLNLLPRSPKDRQPPPQGPTLPGSGAELRFPHRHLSPIPSFQWTQREAVPSMGLSGESRFGPTFLAASCLGAPMGTSHLSLLLLWPCPWARHSYYRPGI